jgi:1,4-alpha-glucan branching enzyme
MSTVLPLDKSVLDQVVGGRHGNPHGVLGAHVHDGAVTVRAFRPLAESVVVVHGSSRSRLEHEYEGVWAGVLDVPDVPDYRLEVTYAGGAAHVTDDAYRYLPTLGELDLHLINEGRHEQLWDVLGAHVRVYDAPTGPITGTAFAVWAPAAKGVRLKGDFNSWDGREHPMRELGVSGVWELFVPDVGSGAHYKFLILGADEQWREKADPMAFHTEVPPATSSVVFDSRHTWGDGDWMAARVAGDSHEMPMSIYEMHLGSWRRGRSYAELADDLVPYLQETGFTHVEFLPVM